MASSDIEGPAPDEGRGARTHAGTIGKPDTGKKNTGSSGAQYTDRVLSPNAQDTIAFLRRWQNETSWTLTAIHKERGFIETRTFAVEDEARAKAWIERHNAGDPHTGQCNVYFAVNSLHGSLGKKATKSDVKSVDWFHVDIDCPPGSNLDEFVPEAEARAASFDPSPTVIIRSGGGVQAFWKLAVSLPVDGDEDAVAEAEGYNRWLAQNFDGDNCHNIDRIMRLPGTVNWPDKNKRAKGRIPAMAELAAFDETRVYEVERFGKVAAAEESSGEVAPPAGVSMAFQDFTPNLRHIIETATRPDNNKFKSRSEAVFRACCDMVREGADDASICSIITNPDFEISAHVLDQKAPDTYAARQAEQARKKVAGDNSEKLTRMNKQYCVVKDGGKTRVLEFVPKLERREGKVVHRRETATYLSFEDLRNFHLSETVVGEDGKPIPLGHWWLRHPDCRKYEGLVFMPEAGEVVNGRLNLWRGWGVEPAPGDWSRMQLHIREVLAAGDEEAYNYIIRWCAWALQNPDTRAEVALVFRGSRGCGKGTLGNALVHMFGQHGTHISSAEHLAGRFNAHLRDACLLFADEAYWPGDKGAEGSLKRLITEPDLFIEAKFKDGFSCDNHLHVLMAANEDWVVPAGEHERRFAVFEASDHRAQQEKWFKPIYAELENGGYEAMLHDLLAMDLGDWHPRRILITDALRDQQLRSLQPTDKWLVGLFEDGVLPGGNGPLVQSRSRADPDGHNPRNGLFDLARANVPGLRHVDDQVLADTIKKLGAEPDRFGKERVRGWKFPSLPKCRAWWERRYPNWPWQEPDLEDWIVEQDQDGTEKLVFDKNA